MLKGIMLEWYGSVNRGEFGALLDSWEQMGVFSYLLPFLLIFALVYGILSKVNLFGDKNKQVSGIIALTVGFMSLRFDVVPMFFADIFPRLGIALGAVLVFLILLGLFGDATSRGLLNTLMWGAFGVAIFIVLQSTEIFGGGINQVFDLIPGWLIPLIVLVVLVAIVMSREKPKEEPIISHLAKAFGGENK